MHVLGACIGVCIGCMGVCVSICNVYGCMVVWVNGYMNWVHGCMHWVYRCMVTPTLTHHVVTSVSTAYSEPRHRVHGRWQGFFLGNDYCEPDPSSSVVCVR